MKKLITFSLLFLAFTAYVWADGGWATSVVSVSKDGNAAYLYKLNDEGWTDGDWGGNTAFNDFDFGTPNSLVLNGGAGNAWTDDSPGHDANSFVIYYRVYKEGGTPGAWSTIGLTNLVAHNGNNYTYNRTDANIDVLSLATIGGTNTYIFELVMSKNQMYSGGNWVSMVPGGQDAGYNAATAGYKAKFTKTIAEPTITLIAPTQVFIDEEIELDAEPSNVDDPYVIYSVKIPESEIFIEISPPYQPLVIGTYTFKAEVKEGEEGDVVASDTKEVIVKEVPEDIVIKVDKQVDWENLYIFVWGTDDDGHKLMNMDDAGWYTYTFTRLERVNFLFVNVDDWEAAGKEQSDDIENVKTSQCYDLYEVSSKIEVMNTDCGKVIVNNVEAENAAHDNIRVVGKLLTAQLDGISHVAVYNITGQLLQSVTTDSEFRFEGKSGVYLLRINDSTHKVLLK